MVLVDTAIPATPIVKAALPPVDAVAPVIVKAETQEGVSSSDDSTSSSDKKMGAGHQTLMNAAQGLKDICSQLMDNGSDDLSLRKYCKKMCTKLEDLAGDMKARAEKHKSKIDGAETTDNEDPMNEDDYEPSTEEKAITVDAVGAIITKSFPDWKPRRMTMANLVEVVSPAIPATDPAVDPETAQAALKRLSKVFKKVQPLLDAAVANGLI